MRSSDWWALGPAAVALVLAGAVLAPASRRRLGRRAPFAQAAALALLATGAAFAGEGWLIPVAIGLFACAEAALGLEGAAAAISILPTVLAEAAFIAIFTRTGGGVGLIRVEPVRLAGVLAAVSGGVLAIRATTPRLGPFAGPGVLILMAAAATAAIGFALPTARAAAMAGGLTILAALALGANDLASTPPTIGGARRFALGFVGLALTAAAFTSLR